MRKNILFLLIVIIKVKVAVAQMDSILYHDNQMEAQWGSSTTSDNFGCFVRFTPATYPAMITGIRGFFRNANANSTIKWKIYSDSNSLNNGGVLSIYLSPTPIPNPSAGGIQNQQYSLFTDLTNDSIVINGGDIYIGAVQTTDYFGIGIDNLPNDSVAVNRQWQWMTVFGSNYWNTLSSQASSGQFGITAFFNSMQTGLDETVSEKDQIFLNPENNNLHFILNLNLGNPEIDIFDIVGRKIETQRIQTNESVFNIQNLKSGVYLVILSTNEKTMVKRIIKQ